MSAIFFFWILNAVYAITINKFGTKFDSYKQRNMSSKGNCSYFRVRYVRKIKFQRAENFDWHTVSFCTLFFCLMELE